MRTALTILFQFQRFEAPCAQYTAKRFILEGHVSYGFVIVLRFIQIYYWWWNKQCRSSWNHKRWDMFTTLKPLKVAVSRNTVRRVVFAPPKKWQLKW